MKATSWLLTALLLAALLLCLEYGVLEYIKAWIFSEFGITGNSLLSGF